MRLLLLFVLSFLSFTVSAIVIRHDVEDAKYRVSPADFPALADMPGEGHGVLISPQWILTAAHAVTWQSQLRQVTINGVAREVERLVIHPAYKKPPQALLDQAIETWDWTLFRAFLSSSADIALVKLAQPVTDISPVSISDGTDEYGKIIQIIGRGATGNGVTGYSFSDPHRTELRRAYNKVSSAHGGWFCYGFDSSSDALPLEGGSGSGDSGGPVLIKTERGWLLSGLTSWVDPQSTTRKPGRYGQVTCNVRLSYYKPWIESVMTAGE
jgi:chymotrypsin